MLQKARQLSAEETTDLTQLESIWYEGMSKAVTLQLDAAITP